MAGMGKFVCNNASAKLIYSADVKSRIAHIEDFDEDGYEFLYCMNVGDEITLHKNGDRLHMLVQTLNDLGQHIQCQAILLQP
ncbi:MAG TPA: hypothetical protein VMN99_06455 [Anaerolineales bacterium]|nr:hypothetical protein [Anaerolineales bacterium]